MTQSGYIALTYWDLALAAALILINGGLSLLFQLGIERTLLWNAVRMAVQLMAVGFVLKLVFTQTSPLWTLVMALVMILVAGYEVMARQTRRFAGWVAYGLGTTTLLFVGLISVSYGVGVLIGPDPWYSPRYVLPILGMIMGNAMTGISLALEALTTSALRDRAAIEARIALGAQRSEALSAVKRHALKTGMMPIINSMAVTGIVSFPGMMTGQILAGVDPIQASKYQLLIMFLIGGGTALGVLVSVIGGASLLTDDRGRLRLDRLAEAK